MEEYIGKTIEEVPEEYREKIKTLRSYGLGEEEKTTYEEVIEFLKTHDGKLMRGRFKKNGKQLTRTEMTEEQRKEVKLHDRWYYSEEKRILEEYVGKPIEEVPEEYREKIARLRSYGLGEEEKTTYEEVIEFLETHDGQVMNSSITKNGKHLKVKEMTEEQRKEVNLHTRWRRSEERKVLEEYIGRPIEEVPEEYREKIAKLRSYGLGNARTKLSQAKQQRDEAKAKNNQTRELEHQVSEQLKKRGKNHEEQ